MDTSVNCYIFISFTNLIDNKYNYGIIECRELIEKETCVSLINTHFPDRMRNGFGVGTDLDSAIENYNIAHNGCKRLNSDGFWNRFNMVKWIRLNNNSPIGEAKCTECGLPNEYLSGPYVCSGCKLWKHVTG